MRIVLDTNSLLVSIGKQSEFRPIFDALLEGKIKLIISNDIVSEYIEIITRKTNAIVAHNLIELLLKSRHVEQTEIYFKWSLIHDDGDDNKFVDCALNGRAQFLVTDDRHYRHLKDVAFPHVEIIRTEAFTYTARQTGNPGASRPDFVRALKDPKQHLSSSVSFYQNGD